MSSKAAARDGRGSPSQRVAEPLIRVGGDFEDEYPGASALATECYANLVRAGDLLIGLHNRHSHDAYQLSASGRQVLAIIEGAAQPLEPSVIAERLIVTTGTMTAVLDTLERRGLVRRVPHNNDRRKLLVDITPAARAIVDELLPSFHARERDVISGSLSIKDQRELLRLVARVQRAAVLASSTPPRRGARQARHRAPRVAGSARDARAPDGAGS